jgi:hypothetical protein
VPAFAVAASVDNDAKATTIGISHRDFILERVQDEIAISQAQIEGNAVIADNIVNRRHGGKRQRRRNPNGKLFLKLLAVRVVELLGATTPKQNF